MKEQNYLDCLVGVIGHPAAENPGVVIQEAAFRALGLNLWRFLTIDVDPDKLEDAIKGLKAFKMRGINCTIPHKINVIPYLDALSESARLIGAVNTIVNDGGRLFGDNTDGKGFMESLRENGVDPSGKKIVILGAGGAARAVSVELSLAGAGSITIVNRPEDAHLAKGLMELLGKIIPNNTLVSWDHAYLVPADTDILVNATSIGLYPNIDDIPNIDLDTILPTMFVQDVIPNPAITPFLRAAEARGARWNTGTGMLINQAALNIEMWTGRKPDKAVMQKALQEALS
ncbi:MAG TPA: shikimate dehydrogenase [Clostridiales bacterium]|jgi:shikimate dehydrogenase|nr:shikimate dehydrogenase [Clostridiales bacterium]